MRRFIKIISLGALALPWLDYFLARDRAVRHLGESAQMRGIAPGNRLAPYQLHAVSVLKSLALATALVIGASTLADAASRQRGRSIPRPSGAYPQYPTTAPVTAGSYGGYSADPHTRYLE